MMSRTGGPEPTEHVLNDEWKEFRAAMTSRAATRKRTHAENGRRGTIPSHLVGGDVPDSVSWWLTIMRLNGDCKRQVEILASSFLLDPDIVIRCSALNRLKVLQDELTQHVPCY
ncbi:unnamed protein product [Caenorhabditis auriculariae]|uniref:Uncharacterized protein n=1 Tax=Caenorhabditis auriculariae TaxID=2777116 RepID=A0A8S1HC70_9PELO|nr:unnamed protein product [Caenorhabditis auriculariae]